VIFLTPGLCALALTHFHIRPSLAIVPATSLATGRGRQPRVRKPARTAFGLLKLATERRQTGSLLALPGHSGLPPFFCKHPTHAIVQAMRNRLVESDAIFRARCNRLRTRSECSCEAPVPQYKQRKDLDYAWIDQAGCGSRRTGRCGTGGLTRSRRQHLRRKGKMLRHRPQGKERLQGWPGHKLCRHLDTRLPGQRLENVCQGHLPENGRNTQTSYRQCAAEAANLTGYTVRPA